MPGSPDRQGQSHPLEGPDTPDMRGRLRSAAPTDSRHKPDLPDETRPSDQLAADDRPARWSRADLTQRLDRLPPGHPSSPDSADLTHDRVPWERAEGENNRRSQAATASLDRPDRQLDTAERDYRSEIPKFWQAWEDHERRWPTEQAAKVDRSRDPPGSWRGDGGQYMEPQENAEATTEIARVQRKEKDLTKQMRQAASDNVCGGWLEGLKHSLKGEDRLKEKIAELLHASARGATPAQIVRDIPDAIRYTFCFEPSTYTEGCRDIKQRLETNEFRLIYSKNHWRDDPEYKGINSRWVTAEGERFEVQFHTPDSFHAKDKITHRAYERTRNPRTSDEERGELSAFQREVCSWITVPEGALDIPDHRTRGR
jgi:hypothetical protein